MFISQFHIVLSITKLYVLITFCFKKVGVGDEPYTPPTISYVGYNKVSSKKKGEGTKTWELNMLLELI